ncbi:MAG: hypothetical protein ACXWRE_08955 [Pseudobdellovibrionaceae bacterium]
MKLRLVIITLFLSACVTSSKHSNAHSLSYERVRSFIIGFSTESDVIAALGSPSNHTDETDYYTLSYEDYETGFQRLSLNFSYESHKLSSLLWIPKENEKESSLEQAKAGFKNATFREIINRSDNPHAISLEAVSYIDEKSGVTIRYDRSLNVVEAIAMYVTTDRSPAKAVKENSIPYTFGDESTIP